MVEIVAVWLAVGAIDAGFSYAYLQRKYRLIANETRRGDTIFAAFCFMAGPIGLLSGITAGGICDRDLFMWFRYGWLFPGSKP